MKPPALAAWLVSMRVDPSEREFALGDLEEEFRAIYTADGSRAARRWYWQQALRNVRSMGGATLPDPERPPSRLRDAARDLTLGARAMLRAPGASAAAILTYALGIGANIAIFSVAWPILVAPLPFPDEDRLVAVWLTYQGENSTTQINPLSMGDYVDISQATQLQMAAFSGRITATNLIHAGEPRPFRLGYVTPSYFDVMGVRAISGRTLQPADAQGPVRQIVISEKSWRSHFGQDPTIVGRTVRLDGDAFQVAGIVPNSTGYGTSEADGWGALEVPVSNERMRAYFLRGVGRLREGVTIDRANEELQTIMAGAAQAFPAANRGLSARASSFREELTGPVRRPILLLAGGALLLLVVAGVNLAGLLLARNVHRSREMSIRQALGAARARLLAQLMIEHLTVAAAGGAVALVMAALTLRAIEGMAPDGIIDPERAVPTSLVLPFAVLISLVSGLFIALVPALRASRPSGTAWTARGVSATRATVRARAMVIAAQVALTVLLLVVASLVGSSLYRVMSVDPGFRLTRGLVADVKLPSDRYDSAAASTRFFDALVERTAALPGARGACVINQMPLEPAMGSMTWVAEGKVRMIGSNPKSVSADCFDVLGIPLLRGRLPEPREAAKVVVVSQSMGKALWPDGEDPVGRRVHMGLKSGDLWTVIGVVGDVRNHSLDTRVVRQVWMPVATGFFTPERLVVSTAVDPGSLAPAVRQVLRELDPNLALANVRTMGEIIGRTTAPRRFLSVLLGGFALIALLMSAIGIYGVLSHLVGQRTREIGIRRALGATTAQITRTITATVGTSIAAGAAAGLIAAYAAATTVASLLYEVSARDGRVYAIVALFVIAAAAIAAWAPARRATRVEPRIALQDG